jgi:heme-degrading monooxygenase HmoA
MVKAIVTFEAKDPAGLQQALAGAGPMLQGAKGFHGVELRRGVELPGRFILLLDWDAVADHHAWMSANETAFLGAVGPYISSPPDIKHYQ